MPSNLLLFLSFLSPLLRSGMYADHSNISNVSDISDWLSLPPWLTIQVYYMDELIYKQMSTLTADDWKAEEKCE